MSTPRQRLIRSLIAHIVPVAIAATAPVHAQVCPFDDGNSTLAVDGLILTRYALGITGAPLVAGTDISAVDAPSVEATINCPSCGLNITGNPTMTVVDATIISRKLAGFSGDALTANLNLGSGTRSTPAAVRSFLLSGCGTVPVFPTCMIGQVLRVGVGGVLQCGNLPNLIASHRQGTDQIGTYSAIAVGSDGLPVVSYFNSTTDHPYLLKCGNATCTSGNTSFLLDSATAVGTHTSVAVPADNLPIISYYDVVNSSLKVVKCGNATCSSGNTVTTVDNVGSVGTRTSIVVPPDGRAAISYVDTTNSALKMVKCGNAECSNGNAFSVVDSVATLNSSIALGSDGFPVIAYHDAANLSLKVAKCADANCAASSTATVDNTAADVGRDASITVPVDGRPMISYYDATNDRLKVARCGNAACTSGNARATVDSGNVGRYTSIAMGADGFAVVSYLDASNTSLKFVKCGNSTCGTSVNRIISTLDGGDGASVGYFSSVAVPADGLPVISYQDGLNTMLKIVKCGNAACVFP